MDAARRGAAAPAAAVGRGRGARAAPPGPRAACAGEKYECDVVADSSAPTFADPLPAGGLAAAAVLLPPRTRGGQGGR